MASLGITMAQGSPPPTAVASGPSTPAAPPAAEDLSPDELLRYVVDHVNSVLHRSYSLVDFDALRGTKLLQVVNDIFATLQPSLAMNLESAAPEDYSTVMYDFLTKTLGYRVPPIIQGSFPQSFINGEPTVLYPTLYWILTHMDLNAKRVYLSRFLQPLDIPDAIRAQDEDVRNLYNQYDQLRAAFVQTHRRVDSLRATSGDFTEARRKATGLEEERDRLIGYVQAAEKKLAKLPDKDNLLAASKALRAAQEERSKLAERRVEQEQVMRSAELRCTEISNRLHNVRRDATDGRVDVIVRRLKDEITTNRIKLQEQIPLELDEKANENVELQRLISEPLDKAALRGENEQLDKAIKALKDEIGKRQRPGADGTSIATIKQQVQRQLTRKSDVMAELNKKQAEYHKSLNDIRDRETRIAQLRAATNMLKAEDFRDYSNQVRAKKAATEGMRTRLAELRAEWGTLTFTESVLQEQFKELGAVIGDLESRLGLQGYSRTVEALSKLTHEKDAIEELKGKTLEDLSRVVQEFTLAIREGRTKLAPLINELRTVRQTAAEVDQEWGEKKSQYEYQENLLMEDARKLEKSVATLREETRLNESLYHRLQAQRLLLSAQAKRVEEEKKFREDPAASLDPQYKTYAEYFADVTKMLEVRTKDLQVRRRNVEENHEGNVQQAEWFRALRTILEAKMKSLYAEGVVGSPGGLEAGRGGRGGAGGVTVGGAGGALSAGKSLDHDIQQVMGTAGTGVDMLVLNNN